MAVRNPILDLANDEGLSIEQKIVEQLLNDENLDSKTDLDKPINWALMDLISEFLLGKDLVNSSSLIKVFIVKCYKLLISKQRKGRLEFLEALKGLKDRINPNPIDMNLEKK